MKITALVSSSRTRFVKEEGQFILDQNNFSPVEALDILQVGQLLFFYNDKFHSIMEDEIQEMMNNDYNIHRFADAVCVRVDR